VETRLQALEEKVTRLTERLDHLEQRLAVLPAGSFPPAWPQGQPELPGVPSSGAEMARWVTFLGRSCLVLGGAFLIRALTDGRLLPAGGGVALGLAFAAAWVFFAHRAGASGAAVSAGFHGVTAALIAYPLILETTARLGVMSSPVAALTVLGFTALLLWASFRDRLGWLAWVGVLSCLATTLVLLRATGGRAEFTAVLLVLAATTFWLGDRPGWAGLRWVSAVALDLVVLRDVVAAAPSLLFFSVALGCLSLALALSRTAGGRPVGTFEVLQALVGLGIGVAGALRALAAAGQGSGPVAAAVLVASVLAIFSASWLVPRRGNRALDFLFYAALSIGLVFLGVALLTTGDLRGVLWAVLALVIGLLGRSRQSTSLWSFAAILAWCAASATGLVRGAWAALASRDLTGWPAASAGGVLVLGLVVLTYLATMLRPRPPSGSPASWASPRLPSALLLLLACAGVAAGVVRAAGGSLTDLARLATARIVVAVAVALSLALLRRRMACPELRWIANLALVLGGVELVVQGLPSGQPLLLLMSFVVYGAGLIAVPRLAPAGDPSSANVSR